MNFNTEFYIREEYLAYEGNCSLPSIWWQNISWAWILESQRLSSWKKSMLLSWKE
jgi:hypothetical protein